MKFLGVTTIKGKLMISLSTIIFIFVTFMVVNSYTEKKHEMITGTQMVLKERIRFVLQSIQTKADICVAMSEIISKMPHIQKFFAERNRQEIQNVTVPLYQEVQKKMNLSQFQFHDPPAISFFRAHLPKKFGDDLSAFRHTVMKTNQEKVSVSGIEAGVGGLGIRGVVPVFFEGKHIGSVEFGMDINSDSVIPLKEKYGFDISIVIPDGDKFKYIAQTHELTIPPEMYPFLKKLMDTGKSDIKFINKNGKHLLTSYDMLKDYSGKNIGIVAIPEDITDKMQNLNKTLIITIIAGLMLMCFIVGLVYFMIETLIHKPIKSLIYSFEHAGDGDLTQRMKAKEINCSKLQGCGNKSCPSYGKTTQCWNETGSFSDSAKCIKLLDGTYSSCKECKEVFKLASDNEISELSNYFNAYMNKMSSVVSKIYEYNGTITDSSKQMNQASEQMDANAKQTAEKSQNVSAAAEQMSMNMSSVSSAIQQASSSVSSVAAATEEMTKNIENIVKNTEKAKIITEEAVTKANQSSSQIGTLNHEANEIGNVVEAINDISEQTNLLALNATIEAARAGEAGKGFAVVANEIKSLANQTISSTKDIKRNINGIQTATSDTIVQIEHIMKVINDINQIVNSIAASLEQQSESTTNIAGNIVQASQNVTNISSQIAESSTVSKSIAKDIADVNYAAKDIETNCSDLRKSAISLTDLSNKLTEITSKFRF